MAFRSKRPSRSPRSLVSTEFERSSIFNEFPQMKKPTRSPPGVIDSHAKSKFLLLASCLSGTAYGTIGP